MKNKKILSAILAAITALTCSASIVSAEETTEAASEITTEIPAEAIVTEPTETIDTTIAADAVNNNNETNVDFYGFSVNPSVISLEVGESCKLNVCFDLPVYYEESVIYHSSNGAAASVSTDGVVTAISAGTAILSVSAKFDAEKVGSEETADILRTVNVLINITPDSSLSLEQQNKLSDLKKKGSQLFGKFVREEKIILGELDPYTARLTLDEAEQFISESSSYSEIYQKFTASQVYPDYIGGSGVTKIEYWFDDIGAEKILFIKEEEDVIYIQCDETGEITNWQLLYPVKNIDVQSSEPVVKGDVNGDGSFNVADVVCFQKWLPNASAVKLDNWLNADFNEDGNLNVFDLILMKRKLIEKYAG